MPRTKNGYKEGKLDSDIAYIKAGVVELQQKVDDWTKWATGVESRLSAGNVRFDNLDRRQGALEASQTAQDARINGLGLWDKGVAAFATLTGFLGGLWGRQ